MTDRKDLVIIGSGPAGLSAAVYAQRAMLDQVVIEKEPFSGGQIITTERIDNYLGLYGMGGYELAMKFREHADALSVPFLEGEVTAINDDGEVKQITLASGKTIETKAVLFATGARHKTLSVKGEKELAGAGVSYCATCDGAFSAERRRLSWAAAMWRWKMPCIFPTFVKKFILSIDVMDFAERRCFSRRSRKRKISNFSPFMRYRRSVATAKWRK